MTHLRLHDAPHDSDDDADTIPFPRLPEYSDAQLAETAQTVEETLARIERQIDELSNAVRDVFQLPDPDDWPPTAA